MTPEVSPARRFAIQAAPDLWRDEPRIIELIEALTCGGAGPPLLDLVYAIDRLRGERDAARASALEEAAKICDGAAMTRVDAAYLARAIRAAKERP